MKTKSDKAIARAERRNARRAQRETENKTETAYENGSAPTINHNPIEAKTEGQKRYINAIKSHTLVFATGPAGTGKTYLCSAMAAQALTNKSVDKIIITRPAVEAGESLGFLPGELDEKFDPYLAPFRDAFYERLGKGYTEYLIKAKKIEAIPLAYMRGRSFHRSFVILDEAQNASSTQLKLLLTRIGQDTKVVINGDVSQIDIKNSGLVDAIDRCS